jgi:hypothetical protein
MKILIDANIFISPEATTIDDIEPRQAQVDSFYEKCNRSGFSVFLHPAIKKNINKNTNNERKRFRLLAIHKYSILSDIKYSNEVLNKIGLPHEDADDYVYYHLLNAVYMNAVSILVSNDSKVHGLAKKLDISDKVYFFNDVDVLFQSLAIEPIKLSPNVEKDRCYNISLSDEIFDSIRSDYNGFDNWFRGKCQHGGRFCYIIRDGKELNGIAIIKNENENAEISRYNLDKKVLKICTFKTSKRVSGNKFGELLLRTIFNYSYANEFEWIYVTAFGKNHICAFFENFGFEKHHNIKPDTGELVYIKKLTPDSERRLSAIQYHILYGPKYIDENSNCFLVPIKPYFHEKLFPELERQPYLFPYGEGCSNGIRKAYICKSNTTKIKEGDILYFYRSQDLMNVQARGVVEKVVRTTDIDEVVSITARRTVFTVTEIKETYGKDRDALVVLFRQANSFSSAIRLDDFGINYHPQSIIQIKRGCYNNV